LKIKGHIRNSGAVFLILFCLSSCAFMQEANQFKGAGKIDLLFPFDLIGMSSVLPHVVLDVSAGFEWHNDQDARDHEIRLLELQNKVKEHDELDITEAMLRALRDDTSR